MPGGGLPIELKRECDGAFIKASSLKEGLSILLNKDVVEFKCSECGKMHTSEKYVMGELQKERHKNNHILLTLCFYEYPAAQAHLDFWEKAMGDKISAKNEFNESLLYTVKKSEETSEIIYCIRLTGNQGDIELTAIPYIFEDLLTIGVKTKATIKYLKTLVFGKVSMTDLKEIYDFSLSVAFCMRKEETLFSLKDEDL
jgi:hypothetical protein